MSYTFHRALIAALATGAMAASGVAFGAPALAATPAPDTDGPMISNLAITSEGIGGQVAFSVTDNPGLSSIDLRDPATDAIFYHRVVDFPGNVTADGLIITSSPSSSPTFRPPGPRLAIPMPSPRPSGSSPGAVTVCRLSAPMSRSHPLPCPPSTSVSSPVS